MEQKTEIKDIRQQKEKIAPSKLLHQTTLM
jgi:hypothetical protein